MPTTIKSDAQAKSSTRMESSSERRQRTIEEAKSMIVRTAGSSGSGSRYQLEINLEDLFIASNKTTAQLSWLPMPPSPEFEEFSYVLELPKSKLLVITASQMIASLISRDAPLIDYFLRPTGLDILGLPIETPDGWKFRMFPGRGPRLAKPLPSMEDRLLWFTTHPGAGRAWRSLSTSITMGRLRMEMPPARVSMVLRASVHGDFLLAHTCKILTASPREKPHRFAKSIAGRVFSINAGSRPPAQESSFCMVRGPSGWKLSQTEWALLRPLFGGYGRRPKLRRNFSILLDKEGTGNSWSCYEAQVQRVTCYLMRSRLIEQGRWDKIIQTLYNYRMAQRTTAS
jgi:hypothetical protein